MSRIEMVQELFWDFAMRAQAEEDAAYRRYQAFLAASERVLDAKWAEYHANLM